MPSEILTDTEDVFVLSEEGATQIEDEIFGPSFFIILRNFNLNSTLLKPAHIEVINKRVTNYLKKNVGFAEIYAMTDRSGDRAINYKVSEQRLSAVQAQLTGRADARKFRHNFVKAIGEDFFEHLFIKRGSDTFKDSKQDASKRSVTIVLTPAVIGVPVRIFSTPFVRETLSFCRFHSRKKT